jgi:uncharacterized protein, YhcH/YjgK/YiaL family
MILDVLENSKNYAGLDPKLEKALSFLKENDITNLPVGKYPIDGDNIFALVQEYSSKPLEQCRFEAHKNFIDIQYIVKGTEIIGWAPESSLKITEAYNQDKDIAFYGLPEVWTASKLIERHFAVFFPEDGHMPCIAPDSAKEVKKVVVKIKI